MVRKTRKYKKYKSKNKLTKFAKNKLNKYGGQVEENPNIQNPESKENDELMKSNYLARSTFGSESSI